MCGSCPARYDRPIGVARAGAGKGHLVTADPPRGVQTGSGSRARPARPRRWLARLSILLAVTSAVILTFFGDRHSLGILAVGLVSVVVSLAAAFWFLAGRGIARWLALALVILSPAAAIAGYALVGLLWVAILAAAAWLFASVAARAALAPDPADWRMPELAALPRAEHPYFIMNPHSGGGKVGQFGLQRRAEDLGAEVFLISGNGHVDVAEVARTAVGRGADLLGVAGGDGTQALVAGVAAEHGIPFVVLAAGTRNHFALDLGLNREDPAAGLAALTDGVDLLVDLGQIGPKTFVNNASFGAYAEAVQEPAYREEKLRSTLDLLPDVMRGRQSSPLAVDVGTVRLEAPQAVLVANNPYGTGDIAGLSRRPRLDLGVLGIVSVSVTSARQAADLVRGTRSAGVTVLTAAEVVVRAAEPEIPVGVDGEALMMPSPVRCSIRPAALRVRVPRKRPGVRPPRGRLSWTRLWRLAAPAAQRRAP